MIVTSCGASVKCIYCEIVTSAGSEASCALSSSIEKLVLFIQGDPNNFLAAFAL